jgi:hypothetical protein
VDSPTAGGAWNGGTSAPVVSSRAFQGWSSVSRQPTWTRVSSAALVRQAALTERPRFWNRQWPPVLGIGSASQRWV